MIRAAEQSIDTHQMMDLNEVSSSTMTLGESSKKDTVNEPHHASYLTMIKGVVQALNESEEADKSAILKSLAQQYHVGGNITKDSSYMCTTRREVHEEDGTEQTMIKAAEQSMSMQGMLDASGPFPSAGMPFHKLSEKKKKILDKKNPIPGPHHPTYLTMIKGAVLALNESKGASKPAILKYLAQHYQLGENLPKINSHLCMALRKALREGNIEQKTGHGASGSFKMSPTTSKKIHPKIAKRKAAKSALPKIKRIIKKRAVVAKPVKPKVVRKPIKKPKVKKAIKKKVIKKIVPVDGKLRVKKKRVVVKSKTPRAKRT
uniref:H15 domain-containing protein n=1 Tax=Haemonchus contortus TaxID=6289 RepID=A0A7I5EDF8_HAECO|nr:Histone H1 H5 domain containing protein [Haemonchus contortus]